MFSLRKINIYHLLRGLVYIYLYKTTYKTMQLVGMFDILMLEQCIHLLVHSCLLY